MLLHEPLDRSPECALQELASILGCDPEREPNASVAGLDRRLAGDAAVAVEAGRVRRATEERIEDREQGVALDLLAALGSRAIHGPRREDLAGALVVGDDREVTLRVHPCETPLALRASPRAGVEDVPEDRGLVVPLERIERADDDRGDPVRTTVRTLRTLASGVEVLHLALVAVIEREVLPEGAVRRVRPRAHDVPERCRREQPCTLVKRPDRGLLDLGLERGLELLHEHAQPGDTVGRFGVEVLASRDRCTHRWGREQGWWNVLDRATQPVVFLAGRGVESRTRQAIGVGICCGVHARRTSRARRLVVLELRTTACGRWNVLG